MNERDLAGADSWAYVEISGGEAVGEAKEMVDHPRHGREVEAHGCRWYGRLTRDV